MAERAEGSGRAARPRLRGRLLVVAVVVALAAGSGVALQRALGARAVPSSTDGSGLTGAWFCPHGGGEGWQGWLVLANPGPRSVLARLSTFGPKGVAARSTVEVPAARQLYRPIPATDAATSTEVEYFGGWIGAQAVVRAGSSGAPTAAERCVPGARPAWYLPDVSTTRGETSTVVVMNPFAEDATFEVVIRTDKRPAVRPGPLTPYVLPAGRSVALRMNEFILQSPEERVVTAEVHVQIGRVVAGSMSVSDGGLREEAGLSLPSTRWVLPATADQGGGTLELMSVDPRRADITVIGSDGAAQRVISGVGDVSVPADGVRAFTVKDAGLGVVVQSTNGIPVVVERRVTGSSGDPATMGGATGPAARWMVGPALPPGGGRQLLVLQNPNQGPATLSVEVIGNGGVVAVQKLATLRVPGGRTVAVDLGQLTGGDPVSLVVRASEGSVVAAVAAVDRGGGYAATLGVPLGRSG